jgi:ATP adenylyltransferase
MQRLWAPWREAYITKVHTNQHKGCVFCDMLKDNKDTKHYIFIRGKFNFAVLNIYPYSNGHCLILPNRHVSDLSKLKPEELQEMMELLIQTKDLLQTTLKAHGFNVGFNLGRLAGAGIPKHVHMHIVPRWKGDHNFMPVTAETKVISQSLKVIYQLLKNADKKRPRRIRR